MYADLKRVGAKCSIVSGSSLSSKGSDTVLQIPTMPLFGGQLKKILPLCKLFSSTYCH